MKRIIDDIEHYTAEDYAVAVNHFVTFFSKKYGDRVSLYQISSASLPSVSDLDLAVIIDESKVDDATIRSIAHDTRTFVYQNDMYRYIFTHALLKYPLQTFAYKHYFEYISSNTLLYGKEVKCHISVSDKSVIDDMNFLMYGANTLRNFERLQKKRVVSMRELLKIYQRAYHDLSLESYDQNSDLDTVKMRQMSEYAKQMRRSAIEKPLDTQHEKDLITLFEELYTLVKRSYQSQMVLLSEKITNRKYDREVYVLGKGGIVKQPLFLLYMGALYARELEKASNCFAGIHKVMYPVDISHVDFDPDYVQNLSKQAEILKPVCSFYKKFSIKVSGPMFCYYCQPEISKKQKLKYGLQKILLRLQGVK